MAKPAFRIAVFVGSACNSANSLLALEEFQLTRPTGIDDQPRAPAFNSTCMSADSLRSKCAIDASSSYRSNSKSKSGESPMITAGMMSGPKFRLLVDLIGRSDHPKRSELLGALNKIRSIQKRDVFAHSYIESYEDSVNFLNRTVGGKYKATENEFTAESFGAHVQEVAEVGVQFYQALGITKDELQMFAKAALSLNRK